MSSLGRKKRKAVTVHGEIRFVREVLQCRACKKSFAPLDEKLSLPAGGNLDRSVMRRAALAGAYASFPQASMLLEEMAGIRVSPAEIHRVAHEKGEGIDALEREEDACFLAPVNPYDPIHEPRMRPQRLVVQADATCVLTVSQEENKSVYCATAFSLEDRGVKNGRAFLAERLYTASAQDMEDFGPRLKALCYKSGMRHATQTAFVGDGARCLWKWAQDNMPRATVFIQDYWHVLEHLSDLAKDVYGPAWEPIYGHWKKRLWHGRVRLILKDLRSEKVRLRGKKRKRIDEEITYLETGQGRMDYARYRKAGWPIGSGAVEGTCKHLVKERFGVTGAQWRRANIQNVLALRLAVFNNEWDQFWNRKAA